MQACARSADSRRLKARKASRAARSFLCKRGARMLLPPVCGGMTKVRQDALICARHAIQSKLYNVGRSQISINQVLHCTYTQPSSAPRIALHPYECISDSTRLQRQTLSVQLVTLNPFPLVFFFHFTCNAFIYRVHTVLYLYCSRTVALLGQAAANSLAGHGQGTKESALAARKSRTRSTASLERRTHLGHSVADGASPTSATRWASPVE